MKRLAFLLLLGLIAAVSGCTTAGGASTGAGRLQGAGKAAINLTF